MDLGAFPCVDFKSHFHDLQSKMSKIKQNKNGCVGI